MTNENCLEGVRCPRCGHEDRFLIAASVIAEVTDDGAEVASPRYGIGFEWTDESHCHCPACGRDGPLGEYRIRPDLPPDPEGMNDDRAAWAGRALAAFRQETGCDLEDAPGELLADLMHWSDRNRFDFELALDRARVHYAAETSACPEADSVACCRTGNDGETP
jgi:hypothetical protein